MLAATEDWVRVRQEDGGVYLGLANENPAGHVVEGGLFGDSIKESVTGAFTSGAR